ncbi:MAG: hypothetical protein ACKO50_01970, partial [Cyanobium sp.]
MLASLLLATGTTVAIETRERETTCPACGSTERVEVAAFSVHDQGLDGEPMWLEGKPGAWPSNVCGACTCPLVIDAHGDQFAKLLQEDA